MDSVLKAKNLTVYAPPPADLIMKSATLPGNKAPFDRIDKPKLHADIVFILEPQLSSSHRQNTQSEVLLSNEFGKDKTSVDLRHLLISTGYRLVEIHPVSLDNFHALFDAFEDTSRASNSTFVVVNLCDGCGRFWWI